MKGSEAVAQRGSAVDPVFADLVEELTAQFQAGKAVDVDACLREHPEYAEQLRSLLPALQMLAELSQSGPRALSGILTPDGNPAGDTGTLGDFRIVREVGRGGMGVVYEAEQISLGRRVALKVLPFAATMDERHLQRFKNEARAAASLDHPHIVPVYGVGSERSVHYYAMKFIDGRTLGNVLAELRGEAGTARTSEQEGAPTPDSPPTVEDHKATTAPAGVCDAAYFRRVAEWGAQAAEALEHAHALGIVHRDVKPANLMIDGEGKLWVTDFGLARIAADSGLTMTGDVVGTLRYMSPEQALAKHGLVDHRTDVYALGATLYELLTLRPAVAGKDREEILRCLTFEEPASPRRLDRAIPADLETTVLRAMAREPQHRYATAKEVGEDLRRFLSGHPILARRPSFTTKVWAWAKRHHSVVMVAAVALLLLTAVSLVSVTLVALAYGAEKEQRGIAESNQAAADRSTEEARTAARESDRQRLRAEAHLRNAVEVHGRASDFVEEYLGKRDMPETTALRKRLANETVKFLQGILVEVEAARTDRSEDKALVSSELALAHFAQGDPDAAEKSAVQAIAIYRALVAKFPDQAAYPKALDRFYTRLLFHAQRLGGRGVLAVNQGRVREGVESLLPSARAYALVPLNWKPPPKSASVMGWLLAEPAAFQTGAEALYALGRCSEAEKLIERSVELWAAMPNRFPGLLWPPHFQHGEAEARTLRGQIRAALGRADQAKTDYQQALEILGNLKPDERDTLHADDILARLDQSRGELLWGRDNAAAAVAFQRAEQALRKRISPNRGVATSRLAWFLATCPDPNRRKPDEALALSETAIKLGPADADFWRVRGVALVRSGLDREAIEAFDKSLRLQGSEEAITWFFLAIAHWHLGGQQQARDFFDRAVVWMDQKRPYDGELSRFRSEAAALLGVKQAQHPASPRR